jgi:uncharacterized protein YndB with AHSA1/START domain
LGGFEVSTAIKARPSKVWKALTAPEVATDWKVGRPIRWKGYLQEMPYENRGTVLNVIKEELLEYTYWSDMSGLADLPQNYARVRCRLVKEGGGTTLIINVQDPFASEETRKHFEYGWKMISSGLKKLVEER